MKVVTLHEMAERVHVFNEQVRESEKTVPDIDHPYRVTDLAYELLEDLGYDMKSDWELA